MESVVSWEQLLIGLVVFLFFYYSVVLFIFYRKDFFFIHSSPTNTGNSLAPNEPPDDAISGGEQPEVVLYNQVHDLIEDCKPVFQAAFSQQLDKEQVLEALRIRLQKYPKIRGTAFQIAVTNHITQELDHRLAMTLTDSEANELWR